MTNPFHIISSSITPLKVTVTTEFGYDIEVTIAPIVAIDVVTEYEDGLPDFNVQLKAVTATATKTPSSKTKEEILAIIRERGIIPPDLDYDSVLIGFVYANDTNPNNHKWWLDFRKGQTPVYDYFTDQITIHAPLHTFSWPDAGFSHGRFKLMKEDISIIKETGKGVTVLGNHTIGVDIDEDAKDYIGIHYEKLRIRYNIRTDLWYIDVLQLNDRIEKTIEIGSIICDATPIIGTRIDVGGNPKISGVILQKDILRVVKMGGTILIKGK